MACCCSTHECKWALRNRRNFQPYSISDIAKNYTPQSRLLYVIIQIYRHVHAEFSRMLRFPYFHFLLVLKHLYFPSHLLIWYRWRYFKKQMKHNHSDICSSISSAQKVRFVFTYSRTALLVCTDPFNVVKVITPQVNGVYVLWFWKKADFEHICSHRLDLEHNKWILEVSLSLHVGGAGWRLQAGERMQHLRGTLLKESVLWDPECSWDQNIHLQEDLISVCTVSSELPCGV